MFLAVPERGALQLRVLVEPADDSGRRSLAVYSRPEDAPAENEWTCHATGVLAAQEREAPATTGVLTDDVWPPAAATPMDTEEFYRRVTDAGFGYGPLFRGMRAAWRDGDTTYAEVSLPTDADPGAYGIHPGLLDSALQPAALVAGHEAAEDTIRVPFSWSGVSLHATGASALRIRLMWPTPDTVSLVIADQTGAPVMTIDALIMRSVGPDQLAAARAADAGELYEVDWLAVPTPEEEIQGTVEVPQDAMALPTAQRDDDTTGPDVYVTWCVSENAADPARSTRDLTHRVLGLVQAVVSDDRPDSRLVILTRGAMSTGTGDEPTDLAGAAVWGLIRTAQSEHPDRFTLIDLDGSDASLTAVPAAIATTEPQLAVRDGALLAPRLARPANLDTSAPSPAPFAPDKTVLITGGTGALGTLLARHLVSTYGVQEAAAHQPERATGRERHRHGTRRTRRRGHDRGLRRRRPAVPGIPAREPAGGASAEKRWCTAPGHWTTAS
nr:polyketide synthase dehydratase domain-containing protein [Streptomyces himastatinicus]